MDNARLGAFNDAILAIVMTIIVLELSVPAELTPASLLGMWREVLAYAVSFFWLGAMWINQHNIWQRTHLVSTHAMWADLVMLFFSSLFPLTTRMVAENFWSPLAQLSYGAVVLCVTFANIALFALLRTDNVHVEDLPTAILGGHSHMWADILIKLVGLVLSVTVYPPGVAFSVLVTLLFIVIPEQLRS